jgi:hypothetical protein
VEGTTIGLKTCSLQNCPDVKAYVVQTDQRGDYRIAGVYDGDMNYLWVVKPAYVMTDPMPAGSCPDGCDRVVTVRGDTRLDIELMRR